MDKELEMAVVNFMNEVQDFLPNGWGDLSVGKMYDDLCYALNKAREQPKEEKTFNIF